MGKLEERCERLSKQGVGLEEDLASMQNTLGRLVGQSIERRLLELEKSVTSLSEEKLSVPRFEELDRKVDRLDDICVICASRVEDSQSTLSKHEKAVQQAVEALPVRWSAASMRMRKARSMNDSTATTTTQSWYAMMRPGLTLEMAESGARSTHSRGTGTCSYSYTGWTTDPEQ